MGNIYSGDNGTILGFTVKDENKIININGATISVFIRNKDRTFTKNADVIDGLNGKAEMSLTSQDIIDSGSYHFQAKVTFLDGKSLSSDPNYFVVKDKLS